MEQLILHEDPISANCYKIQLTASLLSIPLSSRRHSILQGDARSSSFLNTISSYGKLPVLQIGKGGFLPESNAGCWYLASSKPKSTLIPSDPLEQAEMLRWMFFEQNQHEVNIATLRFWLKYLGKDNLNASQVAQLDRKRIASRAVLDCMEGHLTKSARGWFVGDNLTLADIVLFAYTHVAHEADFELRDWPAIQSWCEKVQSVEGFIPMEAAT